MEIEFKGKKRWYRISQDDRQYILQERKKAETGKNKGEFVYSSVGYWYKMESMLNKVLDLEILDSEAHTFAELFAAITGAREFISTLVSEKIKP